MSIGNPRRPVRVSIGLPMEPAMPPTGNPVRDDEQWQQQVRIAALQAAALACTSHNIPLNLPLLVVAAQFEHYILTGETEEPQT